MAESRVVAASTLRQLSEGADVRMLDQLAHAKLLGQLVHMLIYPNHNLEERLAAELIVTPYVKPIFSLENIA